MRLDDVAVVVTTFMREQDCIKCVSSIRKFYPEIEILVADNGKHKDNKFYEFVKSSRAEYLVLPFDSGISKTRN